MITLYFGLPGSGKTTFAAAIAVRTLKRLYKGTEKKYSLVYTNFPLVLPDHLRPLWRLIDFADLGRYDIRNGLILIDEASLEVDNRDYKTFSYSSKRFMLLHRHYNVDIIFFNQGWDAMDKKIRTITSRVFYVYKPRLLGRFFSCCYQIPYGIIIPDPKKGDSQKLGEIVQGYCKPHWLVRLFSPSLLRKNYYKYFDSWDAPRLPPLPTDTPCALQVEKSCAPQN